jgi:hypothetical protein
MEEAFDGVTAQIIDSDFVKIFQNGFADIRLRARGNHEITLGIGSVRRLEKPRHRLPANPARRFIEAVQQYHRGLFVKLLLEYRGRKVPTELHTAPLEKVGQPSGRLPSGRRVLHGTQNTVLDVLLQFGNADEDREPILR